MPRERIAPDLPRREKSDRTACAGFVAAAKARSRLALGSASYRSLGGTQQPNVPHYYFDKNDVYKKIFGTYLRQSILPA
jgi:hypothetical protein